MSDKGRCSTFQSEALICPSSYKAHLYATDPNNEAIGGTLNLELV